MDLARIYDVQRKDGYQYMVQFKRKGCKSYRRYFKTKKEASTDCTAFNNKMLTEGREGQHIGPRERRSIAALMEVLREKGMTIDDATVHMRNLPARTVQVSNVQAVADLLHDRDKSGRSYETIKTLKNRLLPFFRHCGKTYVQEITPADCREYIFRPISATSQSNDRRALSAYFNYLVKRGIIERSPIDKIEAPTRPRHESVAILRPGEVRIWFRRLEKEMPEIVAYFALALFGGLRPSEISELRPDDLTASGIRVTGGKMRGRKRRIVPRSPALDAWLDRYPPSFDWPKVDTSAQKKARSLCPRPWKTDLPRHTYISVQMALTNDEKLVSRWAGNSPDVIYQSYFETMRKEKAELLMGAYPKK